MKPSTAGGSRWMAAAICLVVVVLVAPARALADSPVSVGGVAGVVDGATDAVGDVIDDAPGLVEDVSATIDDTIADVTAPVEEVASVVDETVDDVTETVDEVTDDVTETVDEVTDDVTETVDDVTETVDEVTDDVTGAVDEGTGTVEGVADGATPGNGGARPGTQPGEDGARTGGPESRAVQPRPTGHTVVGFEPPSDRVAQTDVEAPLTVVRDPVAAAGARLRASMLAAVDPCEDDAELVCLGLLFGIGEFADAGTEVLGALALTGVRILWLLVVAVGLLLAGATALGLGTRYRSRPAREAG